ncbi:MAG TPA: conjugative transposon protein TraJ [Chryseolinea sp.]|nr:conjugative transposon protein TraJ [Chryseolinea sp.]
MRTRNIRIAYAAILGILFPVAAQAQGVAGEIRSLQSVLDELYVEMMPLCSQLIGVARGIAAFAALWYIASRVWRNIANAEPIDFYPLLRPFAIGLAILLFPYVIALINGVLQPTVTGTAAMMNNSNRAIAFLLEEKEKAIKNTDTWYLYGDEGTPGRWYRYNNPDAEEEEFGVGMITNALRFTMAQAAYNLKNQVKAWLSEILQILYEAAALCINTLRTFYLIVLAILGPLVFGLSIFDGLQSTLSVWIARYINVFLWLPVANIFGSIISKVQENMIRLDIEQIAMYGDTTFSATDTGYIIFLVIGIIGYFTVPSVANYIVHASGGNMLLARASNFFIGGPMATVTSAFTRRSGQDTRAEERQQPLVPSASLPQQQQNNQAAGSEYHRSKLSGNAK